MNIGNKISNLRKIKNLSQEELAEKVGVTRQTISKWELEETAPDINQAKILSKIFNVSLDELTNNDINSILVEKVSNTERLAGITIKILRTLGIGVLVFAILVIFLFVLYNFILRHKDTNVTGKTSMICKLENKEYSYEIEYNKDFQIIAAGGDAFVANHTDVEKDGDVNHVVAHIEDYFKDHNGICIINESKK